MQMHPSKTVILHYDNILRTLRIRQASSCCQGLNLAALRIVHELCKIETEKLNIEVRVEIGMV